MNGSERLRQLVATAGRILVNEGAASGNFGHVSARTADGTVLIKARGRQAEALEFAGLDDIVRINQAGEVLDGDDGLRAPSETPIHLSIYRHRPDVGSVVHVHPSWVVALTSVGHRLAPLYGAYDPLGEALGDSALPVFPRSVLIATSELGDEVTRLMANSDVCILQGHGIVACGRDVEDAVTKAISLTELARINWMALAVGAPKPISEEDRRDFEQLRRHPSGKVTAVTGGDIQVAQRRADGVTPQWHYFERRLPQL